MTYGGHKSTHWISQCRYFVAILPLSLDADQQPLRERSWRGSSVRRKRQESHFRARMRIIAPSNGEFFANRHSWLSLSRFFFFLSFFFTTHNGVVACSDPHGVKWSFVRVCLIEAKQRSRLWSCKINDGRLLMYVIFVMDIFHETLNRYECRKKLY